jgi:hypothetical protein
MRWAFACVGVLVAPLAVGVGSAAPRVSALPLTARVLHAGDFLGLRPQNPVIVIRNAARWAGLVEPPGQGGSGALFDAARLKKDGFAGGISEHLHWQARNIDGLSIVVQLGSHAAASKYLTIYNGLATPFTVSGIPAARGFGDSGGINVAFADGDYAYLVGAGWQPNATQRVSRTQLMNAAKLLYRRVHGR